MRMARRAASSAKPITKPLGATMSLDMGRGVTMQELSPAQVIAATPHADSAELTVATRTRPVSPSAHTNAPRAAAGGHAAAGRVPAVRTEHRRNKQLMRLHRDQPLQGARLRRRTPHTAVNVSSAKRSTRSKHGTPTNACVRPAGPHWPGTPSAPPTRPRLSPPTPAHHPPTEPTP